MLAGCAGGGMIGAGGAGGSAWALGAPATSTAAIGRDQASPTLPRMGRPYVQQACQSARIGEHRHVPRTGQDDELGARDPLLHRGNGERVDTWSWFGRDDAGGASDRRVAAEQSNVAIARSSAAHDGTYAVRSASCA